MPKIILIALIVSILIIVVIAGVIYMLWPKGTDQTTFNIEGVEVELLRQGTGPEAKAGDSVTLNYVGTIAETGKKFDSSIDRNSPFTFVLGKGRVIKGWDLGISGMKAGEKRKITIPPNLAYGSTGFLNIIPKDATLIFEVELLKIN